MKANNVGKRIEGEFNETLYLTKKYEGFWPDGMPSPKDIREETDKEKKKKLISRREKIFREWQKLQ